MPKRIHRVGSGDIYCLIAYERRGNNQNPRAGKDEDTAVKTIMFVMTQSERQRVCEIANFRLLRE